MHRLIRSIEYLVIMCADRKPGLPLLANERTRVLILGTLPGDHSIKTGTYYIDKSNRFWIILDHVLNTTLTSSEPLKRGQKLLEYGIGIWDVYESAMRSGSRDSEILQFELNDFTALKLKAPNIRLVCFNGTKAWEHHDQLEKLGYAVKLLPSSSGANNGRHEERLALWKSVLSDALQSNN